MTSQLVRVELREQSVYGLIVSNSPFGQLPIVLYINERYKGSMDLRLGTGTQDVEICVLELYVSEYRLFVVFFDSDHIKGLSSGPRSIGTLIRLYLPLKFLPCLV